MERNYVKSCLSVWISILTLVGISGCSSLQPIPETLDDDAYSCIQQYRSEGNPLSRSSGHPAPESAFLTINESKSALVWRQALADEAKDSLDIQYFLWRTDDTGTFLIQRLLAAADRGVRVRLLMDDLDSVTWNRQALLLNTHPDIEIRVFNPFKRARGGWGQRSFELLLDLQRMNHRMHNKLFMADRRIAIVGGRNIGNEYFGTGSPLDYRDYDLITVGPVAKELTESFDYFWESAWAYPIHTLASPNTGESLDDLRAELAERIDFSNILKTGKPFATQDWSALQEAARTNVKKGRARAVFDCPPSYENRQFPVQTAHTLRRIAEQARKEILIISPYVVPLEQLRDGFRSMLDKGVEVTVYTNSLASTDHTYAFSGYYKHRPELLRMGVQIREMKPDAAMAPKHQLPSSPAKFLSLHAKLVVFDRRWVYVGSLNLDPRSAYWNTELGLLIDSEQLADKILEEFAVDLSDQGSWGVTHLVDERNGTVQDGGQTKLYWLSDNEKISYEPSRGIGQKIALWFFSLLPIDEQL